MKFFFFWFFFFLSLNSQAQVLTTKALSFAGSGSLNPNSIYGAQLNPATLNFNADLETGGSYINSPDSSSYSFWFKDSISDAFNSPRNDKVKSSLENLRGFPITASFLYNNQKTDTHSFKEYQLIVGKALSKKLSFGLMTSYFNLNSNFTQGDTFYGSFGLAYKVSSKLSMGLSWLNAYDKDKLSTVLYKPSERYKLGIAYNFNSFFSGYLDIDKVRDSNGDFSYGLGFSSVLRQYFTLEAGYYRDKTLDSSQVGLGLGFNGPKLRVSYGVKFDRKSSSEIHGVDFILPLW